MRPGARSAGVPAGWLAGVLACVVGGRRDAARPAAGTAAFLFLAFALDAQVVPTRCQTSVVAVPYDPNGARLLVACDDSFPDDVLWNLDRADQVSGVLDGRFNKRIDGTGSVIYVIDSGVLAAHDEFATVGGSRVIAGVDLLKDEPGGRMPCPENWALNPCTDFSLGVLIDGHGTAVASAAAGNRVGVAPGAALVSIRAFGFVPLTPARLTESLDVVIRHAWDPAAPPFKTGIVTMSIGLPAFDARVETKIREMIGGVDRDGHPDPAGKRFFFTFFGGNAKEGHCDDAGNLVVFPSNRGVSIRGAVTVGGVERPNNVWSATCRSAGIEIFAPAADVFVASITGRDHYRPAYLSSGTSYAAPYVAGIAARLLQQNPALTPEQLEDLIEATPATTASGEKVAVFVVAGGRRRAAGR
ncbi:MAG: S8 family serine peptidase [Acidobacteriota bacterium]